LAQAKLGHEVLSNLFLHDEEHRQGELHHFDCGASVAPCLPRPPNLGLLWFCAEAGLS
jgi:hypothetical protein